MRIMSYCAAVILGVGLGF